MIECLRAGTAEDLGLQYYVPERNDQRRPGKNREGSRHKHLSARAGVAVASIPSNAADSRHIIARAPGRKYGGEEDSAQSGRVENY